MRNWLKFVVQSWSAYKRLLPVKSKTETAWVGFSVDCCFDLVGAAEVDRLASDVELENRRLRAAKMCRICVEADIGVVFMPCGHVISCEGCASFVSRCPLCQRTVSDAVRIYMNWLVRWWHCNAALWWNESHHHHHHRYHHRHKLFNMA